MQVCRNEGSIYPKPGMRGSRSSLVYPGRGAHVPAVPELCGGGRPRRRAVGARAPPKPRACSSSVLSLPRLRPNANMPLKRGMHGTSFLTAGSPAATSPCAGHAGDRVWHPPPDSPWAAGTRDALLPEAGRPSARPRCRTSPLFRCLDPVPVPPASCAS